MPNGAEWTDLGWSGESENLEELLGEFLGGDPSEYTKYFEDYDPAGEQAATQQMRLGQQAAQGQAQASMWKQFEAGRAGPAGGGFGGAGRARKASMSGMFKGLETGREQAQLGLQEDIRGMKKDYRGDVMGMVGSLLAAEAETPEQYEESQTGYNTACADMGGNWDDANQTCREITHSAGLTGKDTECEDAGGTWTPNENYPNLASCIF